jgi:hypothetical protein
MWCLIEYRAHKNNKFKGMVIIEAISYEDAIEKASKRVLNPGGKPLVSSLSNEVMFLIPMKMRDRILNSVEAQEIKDKLDNYFEQVYV